MLAELRKVIPDFVKRVTRRTAAASGPPIAATRAARPGHRGTLEGLSPEPRGPVTLTGSTPRGGEGRGGGPLPALRAARRPGARRRAGRCLRRTAPDLPRGRGRGRTAGTARAGLRAHLLPFDVLADYGAFRDLQRHRILTIDWQRSPFAHGYTLPGEVEEAGAAEEFRRAVEAFRGALSPTRRGGPAGGGAGTRWSWPTGIRFACT